MAGPSFVGPSYALDTRTADVQRSINCYPVPVESGSGKSQYMLKALFGLVSRASIGTLGRGAYEINGRAWVVVNAGLYELAYDGTTLTSTLRGTMQTSTGFVSMSSNTTQLFIVDGTYGYVLDLATDVFAQITDEDFPGSDLTDYLDQYAILAPSGDQKFFITALGDASDIDALDFASSEALPDDLVSFRVVNRELWLLNRNGTEVWFNSGASDFPIERNNGSIMSVGCDAKWTVQPFNNSLAWLGSDKAGGPGVWYAVGYQAQRISNRCVEQAIARCTDLSRAIAYTHRIDGSTFYCLQLPGLTTTWCFDILTGAWHERSDFEEGEHVRHRVSWYVRFAGMDLGLGDDGTVYEMSRTAYDNAGDALVMDRVSPHNALPNQTPIFYSDFRLDMDVGFVGSVMLRYSDDGGANWGIWDTRSLGGVGNVRTQLRWLRCGSAADRVWWARITDAVPRSIVSANVTVAQ